MGKGATLFLVWVLFAGAAAVRGADSRVESIAQGIAPAERKGLESLSALSQNSLAAIAAATTPGIIEGRTREILALDNLSIGSRGVDAEGRGEIHHYLRAQIENLAPHGVEYLGSLRGDVSAPVSVDHLLVGRDTASSITVGANSWHVTPLWPNGAMPSLTPKGGLNGPLVFVGNGEWDDLDGLDLKGAIALMNFAGGRNWDRLFSLGCQAVIVLEDDHVLRQRAERLFCNTPVPFPRFYADRKTGAELLAHASRKTEAGTPPHAAENCTLTGGNLYERRPVESLFAYLPPTAPRDPATPNLPDSLFVLVPIDSVSVVPDLPHGAQVAANLATALVTLEHLANTPDAVRRKGVVFAFVDGDSLGGTGSRLLAENLLIADGKFPSRATDDAPARIAKYRAAASWFAALTGGDAGNGAIDEESARWLGEQWLSVQVESARVTVAEKRIQIMNKLEADPQAGSSGILAADLNRLDGRIERIAEFRKATLGKTGESWSRRLQDFAALLDAAPLPFKLVDLRAQLDAELKEEVQRHANAENNLRVAQAVRGKVRLDNARDKSALGWYLDLSDGSATTATRTNGQPRFRSSTPLASDHVKNLNSRFRKVLAFASTRANWPEPFPFYSEEDAAELPAQAYEAPPVYYEFWSAAGIAVAPLGTLNDSLTRLDTPHDTPEFTDFGNLAAQARHVLLLIKLGLESQLDSLPPPSLTKPAFGRLAGETVRFNIRSGIDPREPVPGAYVYYPGVRTSQEDPPYNSSTFRGVRKGILVQSLSNGSYQLPIEDLGWSVSAKNNVYAFHLDRDRALFDQVLDSGQVGTQKQSPGFGLIEGRSSEKKLVLTEAYPLVIFLGADPMEYTTVGEQQQAIRVTDALLNGEPQHFATVSPKTDYSEADVSANTIYLPPGRRVRVAVQKNIVFKVLLTGGITSAAPKGEGYLVGPAADGGRNLSLPFTPFLIAADMQAQARQRLTIYNRFGVRENSVNVALERSQAKIDEASAALTAKKWQTAIGSSREAWGILIKFYPRILTLGRDAVFSVIILMALMVPGSAFLEKLLIGSKTVTGHLAGAVGIFIAGTLFLRFFHPAFLISVSPFIVLIAFTMILMSVIVLVISYQRFEVLLRRARGVGGEGEGDTISFMTSLGTAFSLGVSNLKRRMFRTLLTSFTVTVLTFSIVAFVSVKGRDTVSFRPLALEREIEGENVEPIAPRYRGLLFREFYWGALSDQLLSALRTDFGSKFEVTTRGQYLQVEGGNGVDREGVNQIPVRFGGKTHVLTGIMTFEPNEVDFSHLNEAVTDKAWFRAADRDSVILPDTAAAGLGITPEMLHDAELPQVSMLNRTWRVVGILNVKQADRVRDISGKSLAMVDYGRSAFSKNVGGDLANENASFHMSWDKLAIVPAAAAQDVKAEPRALAVRFTDDTDAEKIYEDIALRLNRTFFGTRGGEPALITTQKQTSLGGLAKVIVPVILCILIVTNTMLGAVEERKGEVSMLGSIGLSPSQISFLLLSEATVFSVIGVIAGTFCGLALANLVPWIAAHHNGFLGSLSFNFTSVVSMGLAMLTGAVVLLATLVPARKAAALAAPSGMANWSLPAPNASGNIEFDLPFTLTRGNAVGMIAFLRRFFLNHNEPTSADFNCRNLRLRVHQGDEEALAISGDMWLAPYDLDVAQQFEMKMLPTANQGVFGVRLFLRRTSGTEEAWLRTNYGFLNLVRRQFLLWRHLELEARNDFVQQGATLLQSSPVKA